MPHHLCAGPQSGCTNTARRACASPCRTRRSFARGSASASDSLCSARAWRQSSWGSSERSESAALTSDSNSTYLTTRQGPHTAQATGRQAGVGSRRGGDV
uniref:Uncharacterized protein n=1 Tax=Chrysotila carterae TaxID=13221 RepID=A0A6S9SN57_CHRCT